MGLASFEIATNKPIEFQSHATPGTLIANAVASGYAASEVAERVMSLETFQSMLPSPVLTPVESERKRIKEAAINDTLTAADRTAGLKLLLERL